MNVCAWFVGPFETTRGTHLMSRGEAVGRINKGEIKVEPLLMELGDVLFRDVRHGKHLNPPMQVNEVFPNSSSWFSQSH